MRRATILGGLSVVVSVANAIQLSQQQIQQVYSVMQAISEYSWENGTEAQAVLEWSYPALSVFSTTDSPFPSSLSSNQIPDIVQIAQVTMQNRPPSNASGIMGGSTLLQDDAAADPASLGVAIMLAHATDGTSQIKGVGYGDAATMELNYLLYNVPRASNGAISHRADQVQLWSDSVFMVPPFLAYYGAAMGNQSLITAAVNQIGAYREVLKQNNGLWAHIMMGTGASDPGLWATGNAWAVYGMLRVYATIQRSNYSSQMSSQLQSLSGWMQEIMSGAQPFVSSQGLLHNYINDTTSFLDSTGSALIAAAGYRMALLGISNSYVQMSHTLLSTVSANVNSSGYLTQVVNPLNFGVQGDNSPEGQAFVVMAYSAFNLWNKNGQPGGNGTKNPLGGSSGAMAVGPISRYLLGGVVAVVVGAVALI